MTDCTVPNQNQMQKNKKQKKPNPTPNQAVAIQEWGQVKIAGGLLQDPTTRMFDAGRRYFQEDTWRMEQLSPPLLPKYSIISDSKAVYHLK